MGILPWNRKIDFRAAMRNAAWSDTIYNPVTLDLMDNVRERNREIVQRLDEEDLETQRK